MSVTVNGEPIDDELVEGEFARIKAYYESLGRVSCCERDPEFRGMAKENLVGRVLLMQEAEKRDVAVGDDEVEAAFDKLAEEHGAREHVLIQAGLTLDQEPLFREDLRANLRLEKMLVDECGEVTDPGDEVLREVYAEHRAWFLTPEEVRASHIFKSLQPVERSPEIYEELRAVRRRALAGEDFHALAREASDKPEEEIDLGFFKRGDLMDEFEILAFSMDVDEVSPVFMSQWGYHLVKLTGRKPAEPIPFEEVRDQVLEVYLQEEKKRRVDAFIERLRAGAQVEDDDPDEAPADAVHAHHA